MKRGFLKSKKTLATVPTASGIQPMKVHDHRRPPQIMKLSVGVVEDAGRPDGYTVVEGSSVELDARTVHGDDKTVITRLPQVPGVDFITTECLISGWVKRQIVETPGFPKSLAVPANGPAHRIADVPGMGKGMFATRKLSAGDLILDERPLLMSPVAIPIMLANIPDHFSTEQVKQANLYEQERVLRMLFERLSAEDQQAYLELANCHKYDGSGPILGVLRTNGFGIGSVLRNKDSQEDDITAQYSTVYKELSRINHSCCPNVTRIWDTSSLSMQIRAVRNIAEGEEITVSYTEILAPYEERKADLRPYGIECKCPACSNHAVSDARRKVFREHPAIMAPLVKKSGEAAGAFIQPAVKWVEEMEEEGVQASLLYAQTLHQVLNAYVSIGDERAVIYGKKLYACKCSHGQEDAKDGLYRNLSELSTLKQTMKQMWGLAKVMSDNGMHFPMTYV